MRIPLKFLLFVGLITLAWLVFPIRVFAGGQTSSLADEFVFGSNYVLGKDESLEGNLFVFGGNATLEVGSRVNGDVVLFGGNLEVAGEVNGNISAIGSNLRLTSTAVVRGDVNVPGGNLDRLPGARIEGDVSTAMGGPFRFTLPGMITVPELRMTFSPLWNFFWFFARVFIFSALALLVMMFIPDQTVRVANAAVAQPWISGGLGLLTVIAAPFAVLALTITLILIPAAFILVLLVGITIVYGWIALGWEVGRRFVRMIRQDWAPPIEAGVGTFLLTFVVSSLGFIDCVGWVFPFAVVVLGLGAVLLTRYGTQAYGTGTVASSGALPQSQPGATQPPGEASAEGGEVSSNEEH